MGTVAFDEDEYSCIASNTCGLSGLRKIFFASKRLSGCSESFIMKNLIQAKLSRLGYYEES